MPLLPGDDYDTVSFEMTIVDILPDLAPSSADGPAIRPTMISRNIPGTNCRRSIGNRRIALRRAHSHHAAGIGAGRRRQRRAGISEDGLASVPGLYAGGQPDLYAALYYKIGDLMATLWAEFPGATVNCHLPLRRRLELQDQHTDLAQDHSRAHHPVARVISLIRGAGKPFLWHSCGKIFAIMDDVIALGINQALQRRRHRALRRVDRPL